MKIEGQTLLVVGVIGVGAYLWYKFVKPIANIPTSYSAPSSPIVPTTEQVGKSLIPAATTSITNYYQRTLGGAIDVIKGIGESIFPAPQPFNYNTTSYAQAQGISYAKSLYSGGNPQIYGTGSKTINEVTPIKQSVSYTSITGQPISKTSLTGNQSQSSLNAITARVTATYNSKKLTR